MRLSEFINTHLEKILLEWESFARSRAPAGSTADIAALRDHAQGILRAIARDLEKPASAREAAKDSDASSERPEAVGSAGERHGAERAEIGFTLNQMVSEFAALRWSVVRLWRPTMTMGEEELDDLMRFHEALDLALNESVSRYVEETDRSRELFLGILGHDLRTPLSAVIMSAKLILEIHKLEPPVHDLVTRIVHSGERMNKMVADLLDYTRIRIGQGMSIDRKEVDLEKTIREVVDEMVASRPDRKVNLDVSGKLSGQWDGERIGQALTNILGNAAEHGSPGTPVTLTVRGEADEVVIAVHNVGPPIPSDQLQQIFSPLMRASGEAPARRDPNHLGLGLYIAKAIVTSHRGRIDVESSAEHGTTFTIHLPRRT